MGLGGGKPGCLQHRPDQLVIEPQHLVEKFTVLNMVTFLVSVELHCIGYQLLVGNVFENEEIRLVLVVEIVALRLASSVEETVRASMGSTHR